MAQTRFPSSAQSKGTKLGYYRASLACDHCRKRKVRCLPSTGPDGSGDPSRCARCVRLGRRCLQVKVELMHQLDKLEQMQEAQIDGRNLGHVDHDTANRLVGQSPYHESSELMTPFPDPTSSPVRHNNVMTNVSHSQSPISHFPPRGSSSALNPSTAAASAQAAHMSQSHLLPYRDTVADSSQPPIGFSTVPANYQAMPNQVPFSPHGPSFQPIAIDASRDPKNLIGSWELRPQEYQVDHVGDAGPGMWMLSDSGSGASSTVSDFEYHGDTWRPNGPVPHGSVPQIAWSEPSAAMAPGAGYICPPYANYLNAIPVQSRYFHLDTVSTDKGYVGQEAGRFEPLVRRESADSEYRQEFEYFQTQLPESGLSGQIPPMSGAAWPIPDYIDGNKRTQVSEGCGHDIVQAQYAYQVNSFEHLKSADMYLQEAMQWRSNGVQG